jgi:acylpyruvate hydrolase
MRLATIRTAAGTAAMRVEGNTAIEVGAWDVGTLLADIGHWL